MKEDYKIEESWLQNPGFISARPAKLKQVEEKRLWRAAIITAISGLVDICSRAVRIEFAQDPADISDDVEGGLKCPPPFPLEWHYTRMRGGVEQCSANVKVSLWNFVECIVF